MGDITYAYQTWAVQLEQGVPWFGLFQDWVYPFVDLVFIWGPAKLPMDYQTSWLAVAVLVNLFATVSLTGLRGRVPAPLATAIWLWVGLQLLLGPVAISRLDNISVALALAAVGFWLRSRHKTAAFLTGIAIWVKVWPLALLLGWLTDRARWKPTAIGAGSALVGFLALGYLLAGPNHLLSFLTLQSSRGVQVEAPVATWWLWNNPSGDLNRIYLDAELITYQIRGAGTELIAAWLGLVMYGALAITALLGWLALRKSKTVHDARAAIAWTALTATTDLIVFNKVGSPQYYGWLFVAALLFVVWQLTGWRIVTGWVAVLAILTQLVYPVFYEGILQAATVPTYVLILRNLVVVGLLVYANVKLTQLSSSSRSSGPTLSRSIKNPS